MTTPPQALELIFLGTGGGRFATITQRRRTAGIRILYEKANVHLDPGPGALIYSLKAALNPQKINGLLISHCHPDHYNDAEVLIEAMTSGMTRKKGVLAAAHSVLYGSDHCEASISKYHQQMPEQLVDAKPGTTFDIKNLHISVTQAKHTDPDAVGFRIETPTLGNIAYTSDTEYFTGIGKQYSGARALILCVLRPAGNPWKGHMTTDDAIKIVEESKPEMAVLTHFGMQMIVKNPDKEAQSIQQQTEVPTIAASDGTHIKIGEQIQVQTTRKRKGLENYL
ncbi:MAG TPA: MBL fold metallo-hydrolase [Candidatus Bathyarchaeia archaeon]|nr:MBL fold metallo-hydrolase [Candidatus Bathyarchaeia archaeon]